MENYKSFITKGFASLIGVNTSLQSIKLLSYIFTSEIAYLVYVDKSWTRKGPVSVCDAYIP
jgi:hypothetical protein